MPLVESRFPDSQWSALIIKQHSLPSFLGGTLACHPPYKIITLQEPLPQPSPSYSLAELQLELVSFRAGGNFWEGAQSESAGTKEDRNVWKEEVWEN